MCESSLSLDSKRKHHHERSVPASTSPWGETGAVMPHSKIYRHLCERVYDSLTPLSWLRGHWQWLMREETEVSEGKYVCQLTSGPFCSPGTRSHLKQLEILDRDAMIPPEPEVLLQIFFLRYVRAQNLLKMTENTFYWRSLRFKNRCGQSIVTVWLSAMQVYKNSKYIFYVFLGHCSTTLTSEAKSPVYDYHQFTIR